jgi:tetratricopeptide (TPR) repeat protein
MNDQLIRKKYSNICNYLASRRLKPAFDQMRELITGYGLGVWYDEYRNLEENYHFMLKYTVDGIFDPERQKVYTKLIVSLFELNEKIHESLRYRFSSSLVYEKKRALRNAGITSMGDFMGQHGDFLFRDDLTSESSEEIKMEYQYKIRELFYSIWITDRITPDEAGHVNDLFNSHLPVHYKSLILTAITLSLQRFFDPEKFMIIFSLCSSENEEIRQRAFVGLLINLYKYDQRLPFFPAVNERLRVLNENRQFKRDLERVILQIFRSKDTEKLQKHIGDVLPEMIKISPSLKNKINLESLMEEGIPDDKNPDWEDIFKDSPELLNKLEELSELQMKGEDVFMGSFSMLKSFPFFSDITNWFMPFFSENPELTGMLDVSDQSIFNLVDAIEQAPILCNSDKYSFCLSIQRLPKENLGIMTQAMKAEMQQIREIKDDEGLLDPGLKAGFISNQYIQDLYRFYKLFPGKGDFEDIFKWRFDFHNISSLGEILKEDKEILKNMAGYYFARDHFEEAASIFEYLMLQEPNGELYQKIAWCYQKTGNFEKALEFYLNSELYDVNRLWNLKRIALCYRNLKMPEKALEYYLEAEKLDPDNLTMQLNKGNCLLELENYDQALKCYFKIEYLSPGNKKVWRPIAWCSFLTGKKEQAGKYLSKLLDDNPNKHDLINMGHVQWSLGNRHSALTYYQRSIKENGFTEEEFLATFEEDIPHLIRQGIDKDDVPFMLDQLRYSLEE